jgi:aliphatic nitrilase
LADYITARKKVLQAIADLDFSLITKRKRMMDCVGHYSRPDLLQLRVNLDAQTVMEEVSDSKLQISEELIDPYLSPTPYSLPPTT